MTKLITDEQHAQLLANGRQSLEQENFDPTPVVKLFTPDAGATWLLTELDPEDHDHAFGLCGVPHKPNYVKRIVMLIALRHPFNQPVTASFPSP